jgi:hypothetical protein
VDREIESPGSKSRSVAVINAGMICSGNGVTVASSTQPVQARRSSTVAARFMGRKLKGKKGKEQREKSKGQRIIGSTCARGSFSSAPTGA